MTLRPHTWLVWLIVAAAAAMLARHPLYSVIVLLVVRLVDAVCRSDEPVLRFSLLRVGALIITFSAVLNFLFVHVGTTILARLPASWWFIGGNLTLEALVYGALNGLVLVTLLAVFVAFNAIVPVHDLVRVTPRAFRDLGIVVLVAMTTVPETQRHLRRIREAQAIRGHVVRGWRDWRPLVIPLLVGGLERALLLAEAMVSRGFGARRDTKPATWLRAGLLLGLLLALVGWGMALWGAGSGAWVLAAGVLCALGALYGLGRSTPVTVFRPKPITLADLIVSASLTALLILLLLSRATLLYLPYPTMGLPEFNPWLGIALLLLGGPIPFTLGFGRQGRHSAAEPHDRNNRDS